MFRKLITFLLLIGLPLSLLAGTTDFLKPGLSGTIAGDTVFTGTLDIDVDGVRLDSDNDGMLILLGLGDGSDEDLRLNLDDTSNTGVFTSTTSLATINFSSIALQESGIAVLNNDEIDASSELLAIMDDETGTGALTFATSPTFTTSIAVTSTDPADAGEIRLNNAASVAWEAAPAGTDETLVLSSDENFQLSGPLELDASDPADAGALRLDNAETIAWEAAPAGTDVTVTVTSDENFQFSGPIELGSAGVRLTGDGDGAVTLLSLGNGSGGLEDLTLNLDDTSNVGTFTSSTSLATLNFSSIALQETGIAVLNNDEIDASSELAAIMDDEQGSGALVFATSPTLVTPTLGAASATSIALGGGTALANYLEGTFTPTVTLVGGAGNTVPVYTTNTGRYTRIGRLVFVEIALAGDGGAEGAGTGQFNIALPIAASGSAARLDFQGGQAVNSGANIQILGYIPASATTVAINKWTLISAVAAFSGNDQAGTDRELYISFWYEV